MKRHASTQMETKKRFVYFSFLSIDYGFDKKILKFFMVVPPILSLKGGVHRLRNFFICLNKTPLPPLIYLHHPTCIRQ